MVIATLAPLLLLACAGAVPTPPAGHYRLVGQQDVASHLLLEEDGHFQYMLSAGALDEHAEGRWTSDGKTVWLTTEPKPKPAVFEPGPVTRTSEAALEVKVVSVGGQGIAGVDVSVAFDSGEPVEAYTQEYGWMLDPSEKRTPRSITLSVPMYNLRSAAFPIDLAKGNSLAFTLVPNDLGTIDFQGLELTIGEEQLVMHRDIAALIYVLEED